MNDASTPVLRRLTGFYGNTTFIHADPEAVRHRDILYVPERTHDTSHGLFDRGRKLLPASADYRAEPYPTCAREPFTTLDPERHPFVPDLYRYVFLGSITGHFGHFITASITRLWPCHFVHRYVTRFVITNREPVEHLFRIPHVAAVLGALGLSPGNVVNFPEPVRFHKITVPGVAMEEHNFSHAIFGELCAAIGDSLVPRKPLQSMRPVFLSKARVKQGISRFANEGEFCARLETKGVEIIYPETLTLAEQIGLFRSRPLMTGIAGSGMHTAVFAPRTDRLALALGPNLLSNQQLLDNASGGTTRSFLPTGLSQQEHVPGWHNGQFIPDPRALADAWFDLIETDLRPRVEARWQGGGDLPEPTRRTIAQFDFVHANRAELTRYSGWCEMEGANAWTNGPESTFSMLLPPGDGALTLALRLDALRSPPHVSSRPITVTAGDFIVAKHTVNSGATYTCPLPRKCLRGNLLMLTFHHPITASPQDIGHGTDERRLSISFEQIAVIESVEP